MESTEHPPDKRFLTGIPGWVHVKNVVTQASVTVVWSEVGERDSEELYNSPDVQYMQLIPFDTDCQSLVLNHRNDRCTFRSTTPTVPFMSARRRSFTDRVGNPPWNKGLLFRLVDTAPRKEVDEGSRGRRVKSGVSGGLGEI